MINNNCFRKQNYLKRDKRYFYGFEVVRKQTLFDLNIIYVTISQYGNANNIN